MKVNPRKSESDIHRRQIEGLQFLTRKGVYWDGKRLVTLVFKHDMELSSNSYRQRIVKSGR